MKSTAEILEILRTYKVQSAPKYGFKRLGIFGSVARGEQTDQSDVDVCYEAPAPTLFTIARIKYDLEALLGCSVDLVRLRERMDEYLKQDIEKEAIYV